MHEVLADGEWHEQEPVVREAMRRVPPGPAYRHAERARARLTPGPRQKGDESDAIATGQRQMVMQSLHAAVKYNKIERKKEGGKWFLRDPNASTFRPSTWTEADDLAEELRKQIEFWDRTTKLLPPGPVRDIILNGDPVASIEEALQRNGRKR